MSVIDSYCTNYTEYDLNELRDQLVGTVNAVRNLMPNPIDIVTLDAGDVTTYPVDPAGVIEYRVYDEIINYGFLKGETDYRGACGVPQTVSVVRIRNLPEPVQGVLLIVPRVIAEAIPERPDLRYPAGAVTGDDGELVGYIGLGCASLCQLHYGSIRKYPNQKDYYVVKTD